MESLVATGWRRRWMWELDGDVRQVRRILMALSDSCLVYSTWLHFIDPGGPEAFNETGTLIFFKPLEFQLHDRLLQLAVVLLRFSIAGVKVTTRGVKFGADTAMLFIVFLVQFLALHLRVGEVLLQVLALGVLLMPHLIAAAEELIHELQVLNHFFIWHRWRWEIKTIWQIDGKSAPVHLLTRLFDVCDQLILMLHTLNHGFLCHYRRLQGHLSAEVEAQCVLCSTSNDLIVCVLKLSPAFFNVCHDCRQDGLIDQGLNAMNVRDLVRIGSSFAMARDEFVHLIQVEVDRAFLACMHLRLLPPVFSACLLSV
mmetsp:Transcript_17742/g.39897  ORF Transcript_17742/g.39897 Transcript_17742/m.39897 type:complete len:312 (-) Transcript_17742:218-1153(-)